MTLQSEAHDPQPIRTPDDADWAVYEAFDIYAADPITLASERLGIPRGVALERLERVRMWLRVSGWTEAYHEAIQAGFSLADARDMADQRAAFNMRTER